MRQMKGTPFLDTNVLIYAFATADPRSTTAQTLLARGATVSVQSLNEFASVARRKLRMPWADVRGAIAAICILCPSPQPITLNTHKKGFDIAERYGYSFFDSLIVAAALLAECDVLYSEDLRDGQVIEKLTVRSPFVTLP